jgi:ABC-type phosphate transport system substrate-binding protein
MRRRFLPARARRPAALVAAVLVLAALTTGQPAGSAETDPPPADTETRLSLRGGGAWGAYQELLPWQDQLSEAKSPIDLVYTPHGSFLGRKDYLEGKLDFVLSSVGFTPEELAKIPGGANGVIAAPVQVSSLAFLLQLPVPDGLTSFVQRCDPDDPNTPDPTKCLVRRPYTGKVRIPTDNLAAMALRYPGPAQPPLTSWNHPAVLGAMGVPNFTIPPLAGPTPVLRSDPDEANYYLQHWAAATAPNVWAGLKQSEERIVWEPIAERLPRQAGASRDGVEQQSQQLTLGGGDPGSGTITGFSSGVFAPVPASSLGALEKAFPKVPLQFVEVQNANGDWVSPTPASINAAVNAGGAAPIHAATNKVPGAYPLVWVENIYVPAQGLSIQNTEAVAALIRYLATAGQDVAATVGEGRLSPPLVAAALAAANQVVKSNCVGADRHVVENTDPGDHAPDVPAMKTIGTMSHCAPGAAPAASGGGTGSGSGGSGASSFVSSSSSSGSTGETVDAGVAGESDELTGKTGATAVLSASKLPLPLPPVAGGLDRFATLLVGAGAYLLFRKPVRRLLRREVA